MLALRDPPSRPGDCSSCGMLPDRRLLLDLSVVESLARCACCIRCTGECFGEAVRVVVWGGYVALPTRGVPVADEPRGIAVSIEDPQPISLISSVQRKRLLWLLGFYLPLSSVAIQERRKNYVIIKGVIWQLKKIVVFNGRKDFFARHRNANINKHKQSQTGVRETGETKSGRKSDRGKWLPRKKKQEKGKNEAGKKEANKRSESLSTHLINKR